MEKIKCLVCGMYINEKNYNINENAFAIKNTRDHILYCPFCGVAHHYLRVSEETYSVDSSKLDEQALKILDHAVKLEIFNGDYYKKASVISKDITNKKLFEALGNIELMHAKIHHKLGGFVEFPKLAQMKYEKYDTDEVLLHMAALREKHAVEYYEKNYEKINDEIIKKIFIALAGVEKDHIALTFKA